MTLRAPVWLLAAGLCAAAAAPAALASPRILTANGASRSVTLRLVASDGPANGGFNFDGYGRGRLVVTVPRGWRVSVTCENRGPLRHSCAIVRGPMARAPAFPGAASPDPLRGLAAGRVARFSFVAARLGTYRIACLVPGHEDARMWDVLDVVTARRPAAEVRTGF